MITNKTSPTAVAETGVTVELLLPGHDYGVGLAFEHVARPDTGPAYDERKLDVMLRLAHPSRSFRIGLGAGARSIRSEVERQSTGIDWFRMEVSGVFAQTRVAGARLGIDGYFAWTIGCYTENAGCHDTLTTVYTLGLQLAIASP